MAFDLGESFLATETGLDLGAFELALQEVHGGQGHLVEVDQLAVDGADLATGEVEEALDDAGDAAAGL